MKKIKILRVVNSFGKAGLQQGVKNIISNMSPKYENVVVCLGKKKDKDFNKIKVYELNKKPGLGINLPFKIAKIIKKENPSIIQMHNTDPLQQGMLATLVTDVPVKIYTDHNTFESKKSKKAIMLNRIISKRLDKIIAVQNSVKNKLIEELTVNSSKVKVIVNGTDTDKFNKKTAVKKVKREIGLKDDDKIITIIAGLREVKDHAGLIKSFFYVVKKEKNAKLLIVGEGEMRKRIEEEIKKNQLEKQVKILGLRENIPEILAITDISVINSTTEGISQTIMESMAAGKPVIATRVGGNVDLVKNGVSGILVPAKNPKKMAEALLKLLNNKKLREKMGKEGIKRAKEKFNIKRVVKEYEQVYEQLLKKKGAI